MSKASFTETVTIVAETLFRHYHQVGKSIMVAIDGPDCSGKSTLCRALVTELKATLNIIPVHFDDFLNKDVVRTRRGEFSAKGFFHDFFDEKALKRSILAPFHESVKNGCPIADVLIVEGLFLFRWPIVSYFDFRIRLEIEPALALERALARDTGILGNESWVHRHYTEQCIPAQAHYICGTPIKDLAHIQIKVVSNEVYDVRCRNTTTCDNF